MNLISNLMKYLFLLVCMLFLFRISAQETKSRILNVKKIGFLYNKANQDVSFLNDPDYYYDTKAYKLQAFYNIGSWKSLDFELIVQPQFQVLQHQLYNKFFVLVTEENYRDKQIEFTRLKTMHLYALELGISAKKELFSCLSVQATVGLGIASIDTRTERLAKGFTFIENGSLGLLFKTNSKINLYTGANIGHVSNLNFQSPNSGYNIFGVELGLQYILN